MPVPVRVAWVKQEGVFVKKEDVQAHFAKQASEYEALMERLVPEYRTQHMLMVALLPERLSAPRVLDLGCGNGVLSRAVGKRFPNATFVGFDITEEMLSAYAKGMDEAGFSYEARQGDYGIDDVGTGYDIVITGMTLHHLPRIARRAFYNRLYAALTEGGVYISNDIIVDEDENVREEQYIIWKEHMRSHGEDAHAWYEKHMAKDHPITIEEHLAWLRENGFNAAGCYWRYANFCVTKAVKRAV